MAAIVPIKEMKDTNKFSNMCKEINEPIFVTKNGYGDMVVMSMDLYEREYERKYIYDAVMAGYGEAKKGKLKDGKKAMKELKEKYGF